MLSTPCISYARSVLLPIYLFVFCLKVGPDELEFDSGTLLQSPALVVDMHRYLNDLGVAPRNPGITVSTRLFLCMCERVFVCTAA